MKYFCIVRRLAASGPRAANEVAREAALDELRRSGQLLAAATLEPSGAGVLVRVRAGHASVAVAVPDDCRGLEAFFVLEARDLNEAIHLAARDPGARHGQVEVRPLRSFG